MGWDVPALLAGFRPGVGCPGYRECSEGDDPSSQVVQDELVLRGCAAVCSLQVDDLEALVAARHQGPVRRHNEVIARNLSGHEEELEHELEHELGHELEHELKRGMEHELEYVLGHELEHTTGTMMFASDRIGSRPPGFQFCGVDRGKFQWVDVFCRILDRIKEKSRRSICVRLSCELADLAVVIGDVHWLRGRRFFRRGVVVSLF